MSPQASESVVEAASSKCGVCWPVKGPNPSPSTTATVGLNMGQLMQRAEQVRTKSSDSQISSGPGQVLVPPRTNERDRS